MTTIIGFGDLPKSLRDSVIRGMSGELSNIAVNRKLEELEPPKSSLESVPEFFNAAQAAIQTQVAAELGDSQPGFTGQNSIEFYLNVLDAIDNMILLDFIRDNQPISTTTNQDYTVTKTTDVALDMALAYYAIKYPLDTTVDSAKLETIRIELALFNFIFK